jgi:hypothetical protein
VAFFVPLSVTVTWGIPLAVLSLTVPVTVIFAVWEKAGVMKKNNMQQENKNLPFLISPGGRVPVSCRKCLV